MNPLADMLRQYGSQGSGMEDRPAYVAYQLACQESGKTPLPYQAWVAAGKPKG